MSFHSARTWGLGALALAAVTSIAAVPGQALTMKECSAKYRAAQSAGKGAGMSWQDFRKANCGLGAYAPAETPTAAPSAGGATFPRPFRQSTQIGWTGAHAHLS